MQAPLRIGNGFVGSGRGSGRDGAGRLFGRAWRLVKAFVAADVLAGVFVFAFVMAGVFAVGEACLCWGWGGGRSGVWSWLGWCRGWGE